MKYQITLDNTYILYDIRDSDLKLYNPELNLTVSKVGKLSFLIYPDHPYFNRLENKVSKLAVYKNEQTIFRGRIIEEDQGLYNDKSILCESALAYLNDSIVRPGMFSGSPLQFLTMILTNHNSQVSDDQKLKLGNVTVTDPNNYISRSWTDYITSWEMLEKRGLELIGGYLVERYESDGTYIDWLDDFSDTSTQVIEFGENIIDISTSNSSSETYTVVIPLGAEIDNDDGTSTRLDIKSVNDNLDYLVNQTAYEKYGWIVAPINKTTWDDVTVAANLRTKGLDFLNNQAVMIASTLEITALDLQATDADIESFFINEYVQVKSTPHNISRTFLLSSIKIPLAHPENTKITLGEKSSSLTGIELGNKQEIDNTIERVGIVEKNYTIVEDEINEIREETQTNMTSIQQDQEQILMSALQDYVANGDFETFKQIISTQFQQTADSFSFNFTNLTSQITTMNGNTQQQFSEILKYIRFIDGTINLGEVGNPIILKIENDEVAFYQNNNKVAYLSNSKMLIKDAEIINSLTIGNFAWKPRTNGNLSLVRTGGNS